MTGFIYEIEEKRGYFRLRITASIYTLFAVAIFLLTLFLKVFGEQISQWLLITKGYPENSYLLLKKVGELSMPILLFFFFLSLYVLVSGKKIVIFR